MAREPFSLQALHGPLCWSVAGCDLVLDGSMKNGMGLEAFYFGASGDVMTLSKTNALSLRKCKPLGRNGSDIRVVVRAAHLVVNGQDKRLAVDKSG